MNLTKGAFHFYICYLLNRKKIEYIVFEEQVKLDNTSFIDDYIETTHVLIEQKSIGSSVSRYVRYPKTLRLLSLADFMIL